MRSFAAALTVFTLAFVTTSVNAEYVPGFVWDRSVDFDEGTVAGSASGNPSTDAEGNGVWQMEYTMSAGDGLGGANPWYEGTTGLMAWDDSWFGGTGKWARGDDLGGMITADGLNHSAEGAWYGFIPVVRWLNPVSDPFQMSVTGHVRANWRGANNQSANVDVDVIIAHEDSSEGTMSLLFAETLEKPTDDNSWEGLDVHVNIAAIQLESGDSLLISARAQGAADDFWMPLGDALTFQIVPEPSTIALLGMGALASLALIRRRRD